MAIKTETYPVLDETRTYTYCDDPAAVTRVWWTVASESVQDSDEAETPYDLYCQRMQHVLDAIGRYVQETYPNVSDLWIIDGGYQNQYASFTPRLEHDDRPEEGGYYAIPYEYGFDDMTAAEDNAIAEAFTLYPTPEPEEEN